MKRLIRMLLVNWYRLEQQTIEIEGHTAIIGPNASGKSSLLDAIQAVLVGGHKDWWRPNASAGEKSTRSLRDYCLGVVRDPDNPDLSNEFKPRDQAVTYLVLVFEDENAERISVGLAIQARQSESSERIDGRFIAPGTDMIMTDLTDRTEAGLMPKPWARLREELRNRVGSRLILEAQAEKFQRQICAELSDGKRHLDHKRFLRAFRNAITFAPIKNVSDFVRTFILEERDIQVKSLQQALHNYREIKRKTEEAKDKETALDTINTHYTKAESAERLTMSWRWVEQEATFNALEAELEPLREAIEEREAEIHDIGVLIKDLDDAWKKADDDLQDAITRLSANDVEQRRATLKAEEKNAELQIKQANESISNTRRALNKLHKLDDHKALLDNTDIASLLEELLPHLSVDSGALLDDWPLSAKDIELIVQQIQPLLFNEIHEQNQIRDTLLTQQTKLDEKLQELRARINRLESGQSDISSATQQLIDLLEHHGIEAMPLCDCVDVADENWRDALETFLGGHREALLVSPDDVREAIILYRKEGHKLGIFGSRVINTLKTGQWLERKKEGSLAEVIDSDNDHAIAYVNRHAGNVLRVNSEDELVQHDRAITSDGMLASGGSITRLKFVDPMLGRAAREKSLDSLKKRFLEESGSYSQVKNQRGVVARFIDEQLQPVKQSLETPQKLNAYCEQKKEQQDILSSLQKQLEALLDDSSYKKLKSTVDNAEKRRDEVHEAREASKKQHSGLELTQQADQANHKTKEEDSEKVAEDRRTIEQLPSFDANQASERLEELESDLLPDEECVYKWKSLAEKASSRAGTQVNTMKNHRRKAYDHTREYMSRWAVEQLQINEVDDNHIVLSTWATKELNTLRETALSQFAKEAKAALDEAEVAFRADFIGKLQDNLQQLRGQLDELNRNLKRRPFHGQYYRFIKTVDKELEPVLKLVETWSREDAANVGSLFDISNDPAHQHYEGISKIRDLLTEASEEKSLFNQRLADYRQYYDFDVKMTDDSNGEKNAELLSRRIGKGSGGEHQSPFYVAIGASLAAAYRIEHEEGRYRGGLGLAVFDEAFSKLDLQNTVSALGFLDELGLQVLLAAPDEKYGQIAEHVNTIVTVYREGGNVYVDTEQIKPAAHEALAVDNPVTRPS